LGRSHRFCFPVEQARTGKSVDLSPKTGRFRPNRGILFDEKRAVSVGCVHENTVFLFFAGTGNLRPSLDKTGEAKIGFANS
jgi:hypothetical protein